jgi:hypothetical protein
MLFPLTIDAPSATDSEQPGIGSFIRNLTNITPASILGIRGAAATIHGKGVFEYE